MTPEQRAREFVTEGFKSLGIADLEPYIQIVTELIEGAIDDERKHSADMLAALTRITPAYAQHNGETPLVLQARAAIAKATECGERVGRKG